MSLVNKIFGTTETVAATGEAAGKVIEAVGEAVDRFVTTDAERERLKLELRKILAEEMTSARQLQIEALRQSDKFAKRFVYYFAIAIALLCFVLFYIIIFEDFPPAKENLIYALLGWAGGVLTQVVSFFFGSSLGSKSKEEYLNYRRNEQ